jgi:hypothetical protein
VLEEHLVPAVEATVQVVGAIVRLELVVPTVELEGPRAMRLATRPTVPTTLVDWSGFQEVSEISADGTIIVGTGFYTPAAASRNFIFRRNE